MRHPISATPVITANYKLWCLHLWENKGTAQCK